MRTLVEDSQQTLGMRGISDSCEPASEKVCVHISMSMHNSL